MATITYMRLNRYLASAGLGSRRSCEDLIRTGRVTVNGTLVTDLATNVEESDHVSVDGKKQKPDQPFTLALFKPEGVLCSRDAQGRRRTVFDLLPEDSPRLFYVGRLDMDSEGLLILTNQGELAQQLTHPSFKLPKVYHVELDKDFDFALVPRFLKGFLIEPGYAKAEAVYKLGHNRVKVVLTQGLKRQIRLMFLKFGYRVKFLRRIEIGSLSLGNMKVGEWRFLNEYEIKKLLLTPSVRDEEAPKTFGKPREFDKAELPPVAREKERAPVRERYKKVVRRPVLHSDRSSAPSRSSRPERSERPERSSRPPVRGGRPGSPSSSARPSRYARPEKPAYKGRSARGDEAKRKFSPKRSEGTGRPARAGSSRPVASRPSSRFERSERPERSERSSAPARSPRPGFGRPSRPVSRGPQRSPARTSRPPRR